MCDTIIAVTGDELETVGEVEEYFDTDVSAYHPDDLLPLDKGMCLCHMDITKFMRDKNEPYRYEGMYWGPDPDHPKTNC